MCVPYVGVGGNIAIGVYVLDMWSVLCMWVVGSNILIGLYAVDMWSVLFVMYMGGMFKYSDWTVFCVPYVAVGI